MKEQQIAGGALMLGIIQWIFVVILAEGLKPSYISSIHYVSTLGTGNTAWFYNLSTILLGVCITVSSVLIRRVGSPRLFFILFLVTGLATVGVGVFPEDSRPMHGIVTPTALMFAALSAMASYRLNERPASFFTVLLGAVSLVSGLWFIPYLGLSVESRAMFLGLYKGTIERIVIYTNLLWVLILGSQLSTKHEL
jgi:hypothetical membrane protein